ncbi:hypothetical protein [Draconibacterium orientale]|uniref:hypothetical protein n=1 Tax=Draconibacterium orientale TaxID=1168034 RepID=UPI0029C01C2F|nr:hypothetical protein [Draconibacterium orientale]
MDTRIDPVVKRGIERAKNEIAKIWKNEGYAYYLSGHEKLEWINRSYDSLSQWRSLLPPGYIRKLAKQKSCNTQPFQNPQFKIVK